MSGDVGSSHLSCPSLWHPDAAIMFSVFYYCHFLHFLSGTSLQHLTSTITPHSPLHSSVQGGGAVKVDRHPSVPPLQPKFGHMSPSQLAPSMQAVLSDRLAVLVTRLWSRWRDGRAGMALYAQTVTQTEQCVYCSKYNVFSCEMIE